MTLSPEPSTPEISVQSLNVVFGHGRESLHAVRDVSFEVRKGETFGLVGESGSGKTTVLRILAGVFDAWSGSVSIARIADPRRRSFAEHRVMQMVFQDPYRSLHPRHTVDRCLAGGAGLHKLPDIEDRIRRALADVGLDPAMRFRYPHQISGGQRQRVAIARALMLEPDILLLDEPTSALDVSVQAEILNLLRDLQEKRGLTFILVSHNLAVVSHLCTRLAVMQAGRIVEHLSVDDLRHSRTREDYTRELLASARGYEYRPPLTATF